MEIPNRTDQQINTLAYNSKACFDEDSVTLSVDDL